MSADARVERCRETVDLGSGGTQHYWGWEITTPGEDREHYTVCPFASEEDRQRFLDDIGRAVGPERPAAFAALLHWGFPDQQEQGWYLLQDELGLQDLADFEDRARHIRRVLDGRWQDYEAPRLGTPQPAARLPLRLEIEGRGCRYGWYIEGPGLQPGTRLSGSVSPFENELERDCFSEDIHAAGGDDRAINQAVLALAGESDAAFDQLPLSIRQVVERRFEEAGEPGELVPVAELLRPLSEDDRAAGEEALDEAVHEIKGREAAEINNGGVEKQIAYVGEVAARRVVLDALDEAPGASVAEALTRLSPEDLSAVAEALDEAVHELKGREAAEINNGGVEAQIAYVGEVAARQVLLDVLEPSPDIERVVYARLPDSPVAGLGPPQTRER